MVSRKQKRLRYDKRRRKKNKARFEYVSKRLANPDYPTYNDEYELECAYDAGAMWADSHPNWISVDERKPKFKYKNNPFQHSEEVIVTNGKYCTTASWVHSTLAGWYAWFSRGGRRT